MGGVFASVNMLKWRIFLFYLDFLSQTFTIHRKSGEGGGYFFNWSLQLPPASQTFIHLPGDYCRDLTSAHIEQPDSNFPTASRYPVSTISQFLNIYKRFLDSIILCQRFLMLFSCQDHFCDFLLMLTFVTLGELINLSWH